MRFFALTSVFAALLAVFALVLPSADLYKPGVDDGPIEQFKTIADAERATGYDFPDAGTPRGWEVRQATVIPVFYFRRILSQHPEMAVTRLGSGDNYRAFVWGGMPDPPPGVHDYVSLAYTSNTGSLITLNINFPISSREPVAPTFGEVTEKTRDRVLIGDTPAILTTLKSRDVEVMGVAWRLNGYRMSATSYSFTPELTGSISQDEFVAFLSNVR